MNVHLHCHAKVTFISCMILSLFFMLCPSTYAYSTHLDRNSPTRDSIHTMHSILGVLISPMRPSFGISVKKKLVRTTIVNPFVVRLNPL